jgi:hypothetical protein
MKPESDPITDDEWLLRRVRREQFRTDKLPIISPNAFEPRIVGREPDVDGISMYREACLASVDDVLATVPPERRHEYGIVRISVSFMKMKSLSVRSDPTDLIKGHVAIPELNSLDYATDKASFAATKLALATEASKDENLVRQPTAGA